ncbi:MAG: nuclear transport factor 2 family protein [Bacteroidota bacterium]
MTTKEVADKLVRFCREGKYDDAYALYADDAVSEEMPGMPNAITAGKQHIISGYQEWASNIQEIHGGDVGEAVVAGNHFVVPMSYDITFKEGGRQAMEELCMYKVENGKIAKASYHYEIPSMG